MIHMYPQLTLIGLYGPSRAGKDSVAGFLAEDFGFEQRAMAKAIRNILLALNPIIRDNDGEYWYMQDLYNAYEGDWDKIKAASRDSVDYMIRLGQSCRDELDMDIWLNKVLPPVPSVLGHKVVISDVRQPNEYEAITARGGQVWKITRPDLEKRGMDGLLEGYDFPVVIDNRGSLSDLRGLVQSNMTSIVAGRAAGRRRH